MPYKCEFFGGLGMGDEPVDACRNPDAHEWVCPYAKTWTFHKCEYRWMPTNADRIRSMTDEELDKFLGDVQWDVANYCGGVTQEQEYPIPEKRGAWLDWLKEVDDADANER